MANNTEEEEQKDNPGDSATENPSGKDVPASDMETGTPDQTTENTENPTDTVIPASDTEKIITNQETENMEVHHHGHHHKHHEAKRSWKSYFWEFLMLFLAVFCGFLAEYGLEHKIESDREHQYIETMITDLKEDTTILGQSITRYHLKGIEIDSLTTLLNAPNKKAEGASLYYYGRLVSRFDFFTSTDRTIDQMKNSGAFRLIKKNAAATGISKYYAEMNSIYLLQSNTNDFAMEYRMEAYMVFDPAVFETMVNDKSKNVISKPAGNPPLISYDKSALVRIGSTLHYMKGLRLVLHDRYIELQTKATALIELLKKEYHLE